MLKTAVKKSISPALISGASYTFGFFVTRTIRNYKLLKQQED